MDTGKDLNDWLSYSIKPRELSTAPRPAMWGNGQLELLAELDRPCVNQVICFGWVSLLKPIRSSQRSIRNVSMIFCRWVLKLMKGLRF